jgi:hypothetical protein
VSNRNFPRRLQIGRTFIGVSSEKGKEHEQSSIEFHKIWIDQCAAAEDIRDHFGLDDSLAYLIGETIVAFPMASERDCTLQRKCRRWSPKSSALTNLNTVPL